jgi:hypothetical protein
MSIATGRGLRVHIRTTRIKYYSYMEQIAVQNWGVGRFGSL